MRRASGPLVVQESRTDSEELIPFLIQEGIDYDVSIIILSVQNEAWTAET